MKEEKNLGGRQRNDGCQPTQCRPKIPVKRVSSEMPSPQVLQLVLVSWHADSFGAFTRHRGRNLKADREHATSGGHFTTWSWNGIDLVIWRLDEPSIHSCIGRRAMSVLVISVDETTKALDRESYAMDASARNEFKKGGSFSLQQ
jgi:hypothetical protein